jgi:hypothetical protein
MPPDQLGFHRAPLGCRCEFGETANDLEQPDLALHAVWRKALAC